MAEEIAFENGMMSNF